MTHRKKKANARTDKVCFEGTETHHFLSQRREPRTNVETSELETRNSLGEKRWAQIVRALTEKRGKIYGGWTASIEIPRLENREIVEITSRHCTDENLAEIQYLSLVKERSVKCNRKLLSGKRTVRRYRSLVSIFINCVINSRINLNIIVIIIQII